MSEPDEIIDARSLIVEYLRGELIGPRGGELEILGEAASARYTAGTLYPQEEKADLATADEEQDQQGVAGEDGKSRSAENFGDDPIVLAGQYLPASMGISFFVTGEPALVVEVSGARYVRDTDKKGKRDSYRRLPLTNRGSDGKYPVFQHPTQGNQITYDLFDGAARLDILWRKGKNGWLVTVSLINKLKGGEGRARDPEKCLHQMKISCKLAERGKISVYPRSRLLTDDQEEHILDLLYRHQASYGVGHGCSVGWSKPERGTVQEIFSEFLPAVEVPPITYELDGDFSKILSLNYLANGMTHREEMLGGIEAFVESYAKWVKELSLEVTDIPDDLSTEREILLARLNKAVVRMEQGVSLLKNNDSVLRAFCLANQAMWMQYIHAKDEFAGRAHTYDERVYKEPVIEKSSDRPWRPFQLGFILLSLASTTFPDDTYRRVVDLIWFPTGGGKTEAYLAVAAILIFYRRMIHGKKGEGTAVIMRYTLRLLTTQQFQRASTLLCACELIRRQDPLNLGEEPISIGLWVGQETTPNSYDDAYKKYKELLEKTENVNPFQIDRCPWCGTELIPSAVNPDETWYGVVASPAYFALKCPQKTCPFHDELPVKVVDDQIYDKPPTLLLATVDKFARMAWVAKSQTIFGIGSRRPPELIIQDELHLINGPLGTIVGLYETIIDALSSWDGNPPKILASTATIRQATEQCKNLYDRDLDLFPPSGLNARDSYFARDDLTKPGRIFLGIMGQGHTGSTSMIRTTAAILQAPIDLKLHGEAQDAFSTLIAYHNSLREVGKTRTFIRDDIPDRIKVIAEDEQVLRSLESHKVEELTSNKKAGQLLKILDRLSRRIWEDDSIDLLICSNMFSVGVDVRRLGLMLVNGQPKSTSEYIQCTSRIGRGVPGLVVTLLSATKPRDRSHYERFKGFHQALYRYVEPGSVTPFSPQARLRALHAVLVTGVRHGIGLNGDSAAGQFNRAISGLDSLVEFIEERVEHIDPEEAADTKQSLADLLTEWESKAARGSLFYDTEHPGRETLIRRAGFTRMSAWDTLQSMRNVDKSSILKIITRKP